MSNSPDDQEYRQVVHGEKTLSIRQITLDEYLVYDMFPNSVRAFQMHYEAHINDTLICWLAIDMVPLQRQAVLHVHILENKRTRQNIEDLQVVFKKLLVPLLYDMGRRSIVVVTDGGEKVNALARSFGFDPQPCWISEMRIEKE